MQWLRTDDYRVQRVRLDELPSSAPPLPWRGKDGRIACSFMIVAARRFIPLVVFLDAYGREIPDVADRPDHPAARAVLALNLPSNVITFLPSAKTG
jgi:hypothetical protein